MNGKEEEVKWYLCILRYFINICRETLRIMTEVFLSSDSLLLEIQKLKFPSSNKQCHRDPCCKRQTVRRKSSHTFMPTPPSLDEPGFTTSFSIISLGRQSYEGVSTDYIMREIAKKCGCSTSARLMFFCSGNALNSLMSCYTRSS
jgi:hypothetical protein